MCYKFPGPRCSSHAKKRLHIAQSALTQLRNQADPDSEQWRNEELKAALALREARDEFEETPAGQKYLRSIINDATRSEEARADARMRAAAGAERRENRQRAYRLAHGEDMARASTHLHRDPNEQVFHLATDLDETSGGFVDGLRDALAEKYGLSPEEALRRYPEPEQYALYEAGWFNSKEEFLAEFHEAEANGLYRRLRPMEGLAQHMKTLVAEENVALHVVTARDQSWNKDTVAWLQANGFPYITMRHEDNKPSVQGMDAFIDDAPYQINGLRDAGHNVIIYNQKTNASIEGHRAKGWQDVQGIIRILKTEKTAAAQGQN